MNVQTTEKNTGFTGWLNRKDALLSIDEYAAKKGILVETVEQNAKYGVVQIRRHKGKTFIVDQPSKVNTQRRDSIIVPLLPRIKTGPVQSQGVKRKDIPAGFISKLAWKMFRNSRQSQVVPQP